jgi:membrane-bound metal-dependent hydrolase YbcI (DUF457 family)
MTTPTHILVGISIARIATHFGLVPDSVQTYMISAISANIPDLDVLKYGINPAHHKSLLHKPFIWFVLITLLTVSALTPYPILSIPELWLFSIGLFSHFILDTGNYTEGVQWFWPFSTHVYHYFKLIQKPDTAKKVFNVFIKSSQIKMDLAVSTAAMGMLFLIR